MAGCRSHPSGSPWSHRALVLDAVACARQQGASADGVIATATGAAEHGRLRMQDLASRVVLSRTRVCRLVDLSRASLVTRTPDPADGRASFATITDAGRRAQRLAAPAYLRGIRHTRT